MLHRLSPLVLVLIPATTLAGDPADIPGNVVWLDGSDPDGDGVSGGGFAGGTTWVDKSGVGGADASQPLAMRRPQVVAGAWNGLSAVRFDGNDFMDVSGAVFGMLNDVEGATLFAVASTTDTSSQRVFMISNGANSRQTRAGVNLFDTFGNSIGGSGDYGAAGRRLDTDAFQRIEGGDIGLGQLEQFAAVFDYAAGHLSLYEDGGLVTFAPNFQTPGSTSATDSLNIRVGADADLNQLHGTFAGDLAEVVVYDRVLDDEERQEVVDYLHAKWFGGPVGNTYCDPADGSPNNTATISASGNTLSQGPITIDLSAGPAGQFTYLLIGNGNQIVNQPPGAKGDLCVVGGNCLGRYAADIGAISSAGTYSTDIETSQSGGANYGIPTCGGNIQAGETWYFQYWHRQPMGLPSTFSQAVGVTFEP